MSHQLTDAVAAAVCRAKDRLTRQQAHAIARRMTRKHSRPVRRMSRETHSCVVPHRWYIPRTTHHRCERAGNAGGRPGSESPLSPAPTPGNLSPDMELMQMPDTRELLDEAIDKRARIQAELDAIATEPSPWIVLGQFFANAYDATFVRGLAMDRRMRDLDRLDAAIARLRAEDESFMIGTDADFAGDDFGDDGMAMPVWCDECRATLTDDEADRGTVCAACRVTVREVA